MTEKEFDQIIENYADRFEQRVDAAADCFDRGITRRYEENRWFRFTLRGMSFIGETAMIVGAKHLAESGHKSAAICCFGLGTAGLAMECFRLLVLNKER